MCQLNLKKPRSLFLKLPNMLFYFTLFYSIYTSLLISFLCTCLYCNSVWQSTLKNHGCSPINMFTVFKCTSGVLMHMALNSLNPWIYLFKMIPYQLLWCKAFIISPNEPNTTRTNLEKSAIPWPKPPHTLIQETWLVKYTLTEHFE